MAANRLVGFLVQVSQMREAVILRRKLFFLQSSVLAILCLALATGVAVPLYNYLTRQMTREFTSGVRRQSTAITQYILRAEEMAGQITSRTIIRQELEKYNRGQVSLGNLIAFTSPKLEDAMHRSEEVVGITRLDAKGTPVTSLGIRPPQKAVTGELATKNQSGFGGVFKSSGRNFIWVRAPILNRKMDKVGYDLVVVSTAKLQAMISGQGAEGPNPALWSTILSSPSDIIFRYLAHAESYQSAMGETKQVKDILESAENSGGRKKLISFDHGNLFCVASPVDGTDWLLVGCLDRARVDEPISNQAVRIILIALGIYALSLMVYWLALRPLSEKLLFRQDELEREIGAKTQSLEAELLARRQVEKQLAGERKRLTNTLEGTNAGTWEWNVLTGELVANNRWAELQGYTLSEISPVSIKTWEDFCHPEDYPEATRQLQRHLRGETDMYQAEIRMRHKNGSWVWILDRGKVASWDEDGRPVLMFGTHLDITPRKLAEQRLKDSEERLRTLINSTPDIICFKDGEGRWLEANDADLKLFALEEVDYLGKTDYELAALTDPIYRQAFIVCRQSDKKAWRTGKIIREEETITDRDGSVHVFDVVKVPLFHKDGSRRGLIVLGRDVTQRKTAEDANRRLQGQLRQAHKMRAVGTLAGGIAHDFNNILAAIMGYAEMALNDANKGKPATAELRQIIKAADRATMLVRQILTFSRNMGTEKRVIDLNHLIKDTATVIRRTIPKMINTKLDLADDLPPMAGDGAQIQSVLLNLATNARDAMPDGGDLLIQTGLADVRDAVCNGCGRTFSGRYLKIIVSDNGQGMDRKTMTQMFDPFFTTKEVGKGTGLGMATVFGILRKHEGHVVCESEPEKGTTFHIYLPPTEQGNDLKDEDEEKPAASDGQGRGEIILVVDDEEQIRDMTASALLHGGYRVVTAGSGEQALEVFRRDGGSFDLVVLDISMPGMGGLECLSELLRLDPTVKVLLASGYALDSSSNLAEAPRAAGYLSKPYRLAQLLETVRDLLDG